MIGTVRVYQGYDEKPILEESNLIVDGFKEHIVDIMTRVPAPSAVNAEVSASYSTSNFTVQAMSLSPNESNFQRINSLEVASGVVEGSAVSPLKPSDNNAWFYREDTTNPQFSAVNTHGQESKNSVLSNTLFHDTLQFFGNPALKDFSLDISLSGFYINELLSLYDLSHWEVQSDLRFNPSASEFDDTYKYGSCARYDMSATLPDVSGIYKLLSGTTPSSTYAEPDDGLLYIRSFAPSSTNGDSSGAVVLRQQASVYDEYMEPWVSIEDDFATDIIPEISFQFSSEAGVNGAQIHVVVKDTVEGDYYNFETQGSYARHSWGGSGSPLVVDASAGLSGMVSKFINLPKSRAKNKLEVSYFFYSKTTSDILKCYFWNPGLRVLKDWFVGNIWSGGDIATVNDSNIPPASGVFIDLSNVNADFNATDLSNVTYISQFANLKPSKVYAYNIFVEENTDASAGKDVLRGSIIKRYNSEMAVKGVYNLLSQPGASALNETRLGAKTYAVTPELPRTSYDALSEYEGQAQMVKPSDLCLEVSSSFSGTFSCSADRTFLFRGEVCKHFNDGLSAQPVGFILESSALDVQGRRLKFNFDTGNWVPSGDGTVLNSSSIFDVGKFSPFESTTIDPIPLLAEGVPTNADGTFDFILTVSSLGTQPGFVRALRMDSQALPASQQTREVYRFFGQGEPSGFWEPTTNASAPYSGLNMNDYSPVSHIDPNTGSIGILSMAPVGSMGFAPSSIHGDDSVYQFIVSRDTSSFGTPAGTRARLETVNCIDAGLSFCTEEIGSDVLTSEVYLRNARRDIIGQPYVMSNNFSSLYGETFYRPQIIGLLNCKDTGYTYWPDRNAAASFYSPTNPAGAVEEPNAELCHSFALSDITLPVSSEGMAFAFAYNTTQTNMDVKWSVNANTSDGKVVYWDAATSSWNEKARGEETRNDFIYVFSGLAAAPAEKFNRTSVVDIDNKNFNDDTVITFKIVVNNIEASEIGFINDWRFLHVTASATFDLGTFPEVEDTTVQPVSSPAGRLGQFTNNLQVSGASGVPQLRALGSANWNTDSATSAFGGFLGSTHNEARCVNSEGFIYKGSGLNGGIFALSGYHTSATSTSIIHVLDLSGSDVDFFDTQGGVGAMGLWAFDIDATYNKLLDNGFSLSAIYNTSAEDPSKQLYNVSDVARNPVFKLLSKKVFKRPITIAETATNPILRIVWEIKFL